MLAIKMVIERDFKWDFPLVINVIWVLWEVDWNFIGFFLRLTINASKNLKSNHKPLIFLWLIP
jgi:hypothetical protein